MTKKYASDKSVAAKTVRRTSGKATKMRSSSNFTPSKRSGGKMIGALVPSLTKPAFKRKSPLFVQLIMEWENIVGTHIAQQSEPCRLRPGVLTIRCSGPMAMEIQYTIPRLLERINMACGLYGENVLQSIKLVQDRTFISPQSTKKSPSSTLVHVSDMEDGPLREALERLGGQVAIRTPQRNS